MGQQSCELWGLEDASTLYTCSSGYPIGRKCWQTAAARQLYLDPWVCLECSKCLQRWCGYWSLHPTLTTIWKATGYRKYQQTTSPQLEDRKISELYRACLQCKACIKPQLYVPPLEGAPGQSARQCSVLKSTQSWYQLRWYSRGVQEMHTQIYVLFQKYIRVWVPYFF